MDQYIQLILNTELNTQYSLLKILAYDLIKDLESLPTIMSETLFVVKDPLPYLSMLSLVLLNDSLEIH